MYNGINLIPFAIPITLFVNAEFIKVQSADLLLSSRNSRIVCNKLIIAQLCAIQKKKNLTTNNPLHVLRADH